MFDLSQLGAQQPSNNSNLIQLGIYLPNIRPHKGYELYADIIHANDQFLASVPATRVPLQYSGGEYDLWQTQIDLANQPGFGKFGAPGRYIYRYHLQRHNQAVLDYFSDPCATLSGPGTYSAFEFPSGTSFIWQDQSFKVPPLSDVIMYELMVADFAHDFDGLVSRLDYLESLGVNCIELMPVTNIPEPYRWGYMPMTYFAIEERYGGKRGLQNLVNLCHQRGIAIIHDAVYAHMHDEFCYKKVYSATGEENPMNGPFAEDMFGVGPDFRKAFARDYFDAVNQYFIKELHIDGFRYDYVPGFYDGPTGDGYARLVYQTYQNSRDIPRFQLQGPDLQTYNGVIQAAEFLARPKEILEQTYTSASKRWGPMLLTQDMIKKEAGPINEGLVHELLLIDFSHAWPKKYTANDDSFPVAPLQFIESHDKSYLMYFLSGEHSPYHGGFDLFGRDRSQWYRLQPFAIFLMTCEGVPLLWQGQEFGEIYGKHDEGGSRVLAARPLHWNYFYETSGRTLVNLYRKLGQLRIKHRALRSRSSYYFYQHSQLQNGLLAYHRYDEQGDNPSHALVVINFSHHEGHLSLPFPHPGLWTEQLNHADSNAAEKIQVDHEQQIIHLRVPSHYGKLFLLSTQ